MTPNEFEEQAMASLDGLYAYALRLAQNHDDAADLVQESFVRALPRLDQFRESSAVRPMLFRILYRCFIDSWRKKKRRPRLVPLPGHDALQNRVFDSTTLCTTSIRSTLAEALSHEVNAALMELNPELRETLWLREIEDFSYVEIADILGVPVGTVRSRLARARAQMAQSIMNQAHPVVRVREKEF